MMMPLYLTRSLRVPSLHPYKELSRISTERKRRPKEMSLGSLIQANSFAKGARKRKKNNSAELRFLRPRIPA
jgi:hypothetical protein